MAKKRIFRNTLKPEDPLDWLILIVVFCALGVAIAVVVFMFTSEIL